MASSALANALEQQSPALMDGDREDGGDRGDRRGDCQTSQSTRPVSTLMEKPLSSQAWLVQASCALSRGDRTTKLTTAWRLSALTGSHQHYDMISRAEFGFRNWDRLPPELQNEVGADLAGESLDHREVATLAAALSRQPDTLRQGMRKALQSQGVAATTLLAIGF
jgi:hypothetical protein